MNLKHELLSKYTSITYFLNCNLNLLDSQIFFNVKFYHQKTTLRFIKPKSCFQIPVKLFNNLLVDKCLIIEN